MQTLLCEVAGLPFGIPTTEQSYSSKSLDHRRLTCEEYAALITVQVVKNMDAIAWARVNRKTRMPELCAAPAGPQRGTVSARDGLR